MSKNLQAAVAAAETLRRHGGNTLGHFGRTRSPPTAHVPVNTSGITSPTGFLPFCS
jgi:hypothetical protein